MKTYKELNEVTNLNRSVEDIQSKIKTIYNKLGGKVIIEDDGEIRAYAKIEKSTIPTIELNIDKTYDGHNVEISFSTGRIKDTTNMSDFNRAYEIISKAYSELLLLTRSYDKNNFTK
jgi:hypothetical protein